MPFDISLCMIVRNEEDFLPRCLTSVAPYVSEIIMVDTGSTDRTREIAASFGAKILDIPWADDFSQARNAGLEAARMPWILVMDADETLVPPDSGYLGRLLADRDVKGYFLQIRHRIGDGSSGEYVTDAACRLFRNDPQIRFQGVIHEETASAIRAAYGDGIRFSDLVLWHEGYVDEVIRRRKKNERNERLLKRALAQRPEDPVLLYAWGTEQFQQARYKEALTAFERALESAPVFTGYTSDLVMKTAYCLRELGRRREAAQLLREAAAFYRDFVDLFEWRAILHLDDDRADLALPLLDHCLELGPCDGRYSSASGAGTYRSHFLAGIACERLWLWEEAMDHYQRALQTHPGYEPAGRRLAELKCLFDMNSAQGGNQSVPMNTENPGAPVPPPDRGPADPSIDLLPPRPLHLLGVSREQIATWARQYLSLSSEPTYQEALLAGWLALESDLDTLAAKWFALAAGMYPHRAAPWVGRFLAAVHTFQRLVPDVAARVLPGPLPWALHSRQLLAALSEPPF